MQDTSGIESALQERLSQIVNKDLSLREVSKIVELFAPTQPSVNVEDVEKAAQEIIEDLLDAIPKQDNDHDWWPDDLTHAVKNANEFLESKQNKESIEDEDAIWEEISIILGVKYSHKEEINKFKKQFYIYRKY